MFGSTGEACADTLLGCRTEPSVLPLAVPFGHIEKRKGAKGKIAKIAKSQKGKIMETAKPTNFKSRRKQDHIEPREVRKHQIQVMLNDQELAFLDSVRGRVRRAEAMRFLLQENPPKSVPPLNQGAWIILATAVSNINQASRKLNAGEVPDLDKIKSELNDFRAALLGAKL